MVCIMKRIAGALLSVFSWLSLVAASESHNADVMSLTQEQRAVYLAQLKRENPHVSSRDTVWQRIERNLEIMCYDPLGFYTESEREKLLLNHVMHRELILEGKPIADELGPEAAREMCECFERDQEESIKTYRRVKRIPEHPGLQKVYYMMTICGLAGFTDSWTPCYCCAVQTALGCWTT